MKKTKKPYKGRFKQIVRLSIFVIRKTQLCNDINST